MLQLKHKSTGFELTDRVTTLELSGQEVKVADQVFNEPGEYETHNIEIVYGEQAALIVWEHLQVVYIFSAGTPGTFEKDQFASSDVIILGDNLAELTKSALDELLGIYDPKVVAFSPLASVESTLKSSLKLQEVPAIKLGRASLPEEGREFYLAS